MSMKKFAIIALLCVMALPVFAQQKYALVIGNGNYSGITKLNNPVNDANDMAVALQGLGFTVDKVLNGSLEQMEGAVTRLKSRLAGAGSAYGLLFYAGHGVQSNGENYLIPVDAAIQSESYLRNRALSVSAMLDELNAAGNELNIVILDACRDNPFSWKRSGTRGLTLVANQPKGSLIVYATAAGSTVADGNGRNGLFTGHLLTNLKTPGLEVTEVFRRTMGDVARSSDNQQHPAVYNQYPGVAYLGTRPTVVTPTPAPVTPAPVPPTAPPPIRPASANMVWVEGGTFQMGSESGESHEKPVHEVTVKGFYLGKYEVTQKEWYDVMGTMVRQQRDMADKAWSMAGEGDNYPMYYVSWQEAIEYCNRRSMKEGLTPCYRGSGNSITCDWKANGYRLPTEAEWEYAAKDGIKNFLTTEYAGSNSVGAVAWYGDNSDGSTHAVGTKAGNALGIYDMSGNVWEWCWDWKGDYNGSAQTDQRGPASGSYRVCRGGTWSHPASYARSAGRNGGPPSSRSDNLGFRLARNAQ
jgi:formylglycine-generating enzyme required for sulfatase activity